MRAVWRGFTETGNMGNYYELLQVSTGASTDVIRNAYKALAKKYHPDLNRDDPEAAGRVMTELNLAVEVLTDAARRRAYDEANGIVSDARDDAHVREIDKFLFGDKPKKKDEGFVVEFEDSEGLSDFESELASIKNGDLAELSDDVSEEDETEEKPRIGKWYYATMAALGAGCVIFLALLIAAYWDGLLGDFFRSR